MNNKWIKFEKELATGDPKVLRIASRLRNACVTPESLYTLATLGALTRLWSFADTHIRDDDTLSSTIAEINEVIGIANFCDLLPPEWLQVLDGDRVHLPDFLAHNGIKARTRALGAGRQKRYRAKHNGSVTPKSRKSNGKSNAEVTEHALPKTSDLQTSKESPIDPPLPKKAKAEKKPTENKRGAQIAEDWALTPALREFAADNGLDAERTAEQFKAYWGAASGGTSYKRNWNYAFRTWCWKALEYAKANAARNGNGHNTAPAANRDAAAWAEARTHAKATGFRPPYEHESVSAYQTAAKNASLARPPEALRLGLAGLTARLTR